MELAAFSGLMALGQMTPGPDWILVTRHALVGGIRAGVWTASGIACGLAIHATLALAGLAYSLHGQDAMWNGLRWVAAGYLVWLGWRIAKERVVSSGRGMHGDQIGVVERPFLRGFLCNLLNLKVVLLLAAVCSAFLDNHKSAGWVAALWLIIVIQGWLLWILWAALLRSRAAMSLHARYGRWMDALFAGGLILVALRLLFAEM